VVLKVTRIAKGLKGTIALNNVNMHSVIIHLPLRDSVYAGVTK
jgi:hypothetical protein